MKVFYEINAYIHSKIWKENKDAILKENIISGTCLWCVEVWDYYPG